MIDMHIGQLSFSSKQTDYDNFLMERTCNNDSSQHHDFDEVALKKTRSLLLYHLIMCTDY